MYKFVSKNVMEDAIAFSWFNVKYAFYKALFAYLFVTVAALISIIANPSSLKSIIIGTLIVLVGVAFLLIYKMIKKTPLKNGLVKKTKEIRITFDENKISSETVYDDGMANGECKYESFVKIREDKQRIYCYLGNSSALILNKNSIDNIDEFRIFLRKKVNRGF